MAAATAAVTSAPVFASFANVGAPGSQQIEIAVTVRFDCTEMEPQSAGSVTIRPGVRLTLPAPYGGPPVVRGGGTVVGGDDTIRRFTMLVDVAAWPAGTRTALAARLGSSRAGSTLDGRHGARRVARRRWRGTEHFGE